MERVSSSRFADFGALLEPLRHRSPSQGSTTAPSGKSERLRHVIDAAVRRTAGRGGVGVPVTDRPAGTIVILFGSARSSGVKRSGIWLGCPSAIWPTGALMVVAGRGKVYCLCSSCPSG